MPKPLNVDLPYPSIKGVTPDALSLKIISPQYATANGELNAILSYVYHSFFFEKEGFEGYADILMSIAVSEMMHLKILGKLILSLGGAPIYTQYPPNCFNFYSTKYVAYSRSLKNMLEDDILGEKRAIASYEKMLRCLKNSQVKEIIDRILQDEYLHLSTLEKMLVAFKC